MQFPNGSVFGFQSDVVSPPPSAEVGGPRQIKSYAEKCYQQNQTPQLSQWAEATMDIRYYVGDQTLYDRVWATYGGIRKRGFNFNLMRPLVQMVSGYQRQHRKSIVATPQEDKDSRACSQLTKALMWAVNKNNILETISDAFESGALVTGCNLLYCGLDYRSDPVNGDIFVDRIPYNAYAIDYDFRKPDLSDCQWVWVRKIGSDEEMRKVLPPGIVVPQGSLQGYRDGKFQFVPEIQITPLVQQRTIDEFWYLTERKQKFLLDVRSGDLEEWAESEEELNELLMRNPYFDVIEQMVPTVRLAIMVDGNVVWDGPNPYGIDEYPFVPVIGYYQPEVAFWPLRCQGLCRGLRDVSWIYNRLKLTQLDIFESQPNSGWIYKESALVNPADLLNVGEGRLIALRDEANRSDVEQLPPPRIDQSMIELSNSLKTLMREVTGINEELLGSAIDEKAGILAMLRQGAGLTTLQTLFDHLDLSQKVLGQRMAKMIQKNWRPSKIERICGERADEKFYARSLIKFDCVVEEGLNTSTQRQMQMAQLIQLHGLGVPVPPEQLILASSLQNKDELLEDIQIRAEMEKAAQQAQAQADQAFQMAKSQQAAASSMADQALAQERMARSQEYQMNAVEKIMGAEKQEEEAVLSLVKALKELQGLDIRHVADSVAILRSLHDAAISDETRMAQQQLNAQQAQTTQAQQQAVVPEPMVNPLGSIGSAPEMMATPAGGLV